ncbi:GntR family transcriptional regulator [Caldalkalibacillus thermarum]|uniref:GntR family transcriptional regulator n=1 Tax=Caldalkalibacillus thermarum TaxID=296745 RepID=UPI00166C6FC2|nr:GntR family transcriptional regulator [Caldalkalibacillus thermarum]GGK34449.1 GntR family transcriptional regulator [Caldalkalibacillus thermarum]
MKKLKPAETLAEQAYQVIKKAIINNEFGPNEALVEEHIAQELGISRTPIRAALNQLAYEGLIEIKAGKGARVSAISEKDVLDFQLLRDALEPLAAKIAADKINEQDIEQLRQICDQQYQSIANKDYYRFIELDYQFHSKIAQITENAKLSEIVDNLNNQIQRFLILSNTLQDSALGAVEEHLTLVKALEARDADLAEKMMRQHVQNVTTRILTSS